MAATTLTPKIASMGPLRPGDPPVPLNDSDTLLAEPLLKRGLLHSVD